MPKNGYKDQMKKGFTLVELSIVLVIIGLLIGGILVAQSMISSAKINSAISQLNQYGVAIVNFKTKYNSLPGDSAYFPNPGNTDGIISDAESANFWVHLSQGVELKTPTGNNYSVLDDIPTEETCPVLKLNQRNQEVVDATLGMGTGKVCLSAFDANASNTNVLSYTIAAPPSEITSGDPVADPLLPSDTLSLDNKIDDGAPLTGNFIAWTDPIGAGNSNGPCLSGSNYDVSSKEFGCSFSIKFKGLNIE